MSSDDSEKDVEGSGSLTLGTSSGAGDKINVVDGNTKFSVYSENVRHYSGLRFVALSAWIVVAGSLSRVIIDRMSLENYDPGNLVLIAALALAFTFIMWMIEVRIDQYINHYKDLLADMDFPGPSDSLKATHEAVVWIYGIGCTAFSILCLVLGYSHLSG